MHRIAASILSADRRRLPDEVRRLVAAGVDAIHMNVVDAEDRPNLSLGHLACAAIRAHCTLPIHVHLRVPARRALVDNFAEAGADLLILQSAAGLDAPAMLAQVRAALEVKRGEALPVQLVDEREDVNPPHLAYLE